ncbi:rho GTPase-activating protein 6 [Galendromus occidentalis]|uniref:Rho GTPase-activating protein 6 n=1 Tax=Galendromus occidentalis TaxID=34638 RepID=A0AAJ7SGU5_9ACAR|nr:rho GTPase-activating protein 6 [Galendromus occidentalis]
MHGGSSGHKHRSSARSRAKSQSRIGALQLCTWMPEGDCTWRSTEWQCKAQVGSGSLVSLSDAESHTLALISLERINQFQGFKIPSLPRDEDLAPKGKSRRKPTALLRRKSATTSFIEMSSRLANEIASEEKCCFAVPLTKLINRDAKLHGVSTIQADVDSLHELTYSMRFKGVLDEDQEEDPSPERRHSKDESWEADSDEAPSKKGGNSGSNRERTQSADLGASAMSSSLLAVQKLASAKTVPSVRAVTSSTYSLHVSDERTGPRVPRIVNSCLKYLYKYGPTTVGVFRVSSSKRRVRQLRELFDSGSEQVEKLLGVNADPSLDSSDSGDESRWDDSTWPKEWESWPRSGGGAHDVAQILKEFFRDLPEPLMTRQLYSAFLHTLRLPRESQLTSVVHLIRLLPSANRDVLWALLRLLRNICTHSTNKDDSLQGNKMDANNLATVLGPNILRTNPTPSVATGPKSYFVEKLERAEERSDVILVVRYLIENFERLFSVSAQDMDAMYRRMLVEEPQRLESLFTDRFLSSNCDAPPRLSSRRLSRDEVFTPQEGNQERERGRKGILRRATEKTDYRELSRYRQSSAESTTSMKIKGRLNSSSSKDTSQSSLNDWENPAGVGGLSGVRGGGALNANHWDQSQFSAFVGATQTPPSITVTLSKEKKARSKSKSKSKNETVAAEPREQRSFALKKSKSASALLSGILFGSFRRDSDTSPSPSMDEDDFAGRRASSSYTQYSSGMAVCRRADLISSECRKPRER